MEIRWEVMIIHRDHSVVLSFCADSVTQNINYYQQNLFSITVKMPYFHPCH